MVFPGSWILHQKIMFESNYILYFIKDHLLPWYHQSTFSNMNRCRLVVFSPAFSTPFVRKSLQSELFLSIKHPSLFLHCFLNVSCTVWLHYQDGTFSIKHRSGTDCFCRRTAALRRVWTGKSCSFIRMSVIYACVLCFCWWGLLWCCYNVIFQSPLHLRI